MSALQIYIINRLPLSFSGYETMELPIELWKMNFNKNTIYVLLIFNIQGYVIAHGTYQNLCNFSFLICTYLYLENKHKLAISVPYK